MNDKIISVVLNERVIAEANMQVMCALLGISIDEMLNMSMSDIEDKYPEDILPRYGFILNQLLLKFIEYHPEPEHAREEILKGMSLEYFKTKLNYV